MAYDNGLVQEYIMQLRMEGKAETTIYARAGALRRLSKWLGGCLIRDAGRDELIGWRATLAGRADSYVLAQVSHVRCYLAWQHENGHRQDNPGPKIPVPRKPFHLPHPIGEEELLDALGNADRRIRLWIVLAAWCGLRAKEIACLRRRCVRERAEHPHILVMADATKGNRERVVPLCRFAAAEITAARLPSGVWVSPRLDGEPGHVTPHRVSQVCNEFLHSLGYPDTLHSLRDRFATQALRGCRNVRVVQVLLGHARLDTTAVYTLVADAETAAAVAMIPAPRRLRAAS